MPDMDHAEALAQLIVCCKRSPDCFRLKTRKALKRLDTEAFHAPSTLQTDEASSILQKAWELHMAPRSYPVKH